MPKKSLRKEMLFKRSRLDLASLASIEANVVSQLFKLDLIRESRVVAIYAATNKEVGTEKLFLELKSFRKTVCYPKVQGDLLSFIATKEIASLVSGKFGIPEPVNLNEIIPLNEIDTFILPGIAFDISGHRVGYGMGYYDRTLTDKGVNSRLVGICHDFQLLDAVPSYDHDIRMNYVVTEHRAVSCPCD